MKSKLIEIFFSALCADFVPPIDYIDSEDKFADYIGDGICNDVTNVPEYNYDGGDCCNQTSIFGHPYCLLCECLEPQVDNDDLWKTWETRRNHQGLRVVHVGMFNDTFCDELLNNEENNFDGGDCCRDFRDPNIFHYENFCFKNCECVENSV